MKKHDYGTEQVGAYLLDFNRYRCRCRRTTASNDERGQASDPLHIETETCLEQFFLGAHIHQFEAPASRLHLTPKCIAKPARPVEARQVSTIWGASLNV